MLDDSCNSRPCVFFGTTSPDLGARYADAMFLAVLGGAIIGLASALFLLTHGRVAGISGLYGEIFRASADRGSRVAFVAGLVITGFVIHAFVPGRFGGATVGLPLVAVAGVLVGFGTQLGSGCTSGHGVCGIGRGSPRSIVATLTFMATGFLAVFVVRHLVGPS